jgi:hypothetical protein
VSFTLDFEAGDPNLHAYLSNAPTVLVDPTGEFPWAPLIGCLIAVGGSAGGDYMAGRKID